MAALAWVSVTPTALTLDCGSRDACSSSGPTSSAFLASRLRWRLCSGTDQLRASCPPCTLSVSRSSVCCVASAAEIPTVSATKTAFLNAFRKPIPSIYSNVIQDLLVQQHLMRYNQTYEYDPVFALGYVTVYDQLMDGYPSEEDQEAIFKAYITALKEDPEQYRTDAKKLEEWASGQTSASVVAFSEQEGEVPEVLKGISERARTGKKFHYSKFFAIGLFRLLECAKASEPAVLDQLAKALNVSKLSVDRDLDVYRNLLSKLLQAKELVKEYVERERKKQVEREAEKADKTDKKAETPSVAKAEVNSE